jgi:hypothetical protein
VHGEFYASNVLVAQDGERTRVCPVDWEMTGVGPALLDLAALTAGEWSEEERAAIVRAYRDELPPGCAWALTGDAFAPALDCCRLHLAMQLVGWASDWTPPAAHAHDWLAEALATAERLRL